MNYLYDTHGWYSGESETPTRRSTETAPPSRSLTETPGEPRANWTGREWRVLSYVTPVIDPPAPPPVPSGVTPRQARMALTQVGLRAQVEQAVAAASQDVKDTWEFSVQVERDNPVLAALARQLNLTPEQVDDLFRLAATL